MVVGRFALRCPLSFAASITRRRGIVRNVRSHGASMNLVTFLNSGAAKCGRRAIVSEHAFSVRPQVGLSFIEHLNACSENECPYTKHVYVFGWNHEVKKCFVFRPNCNQWSCEVCSLKNARKWIARVINGVNELGGDWWFLTLTAHAKMRGTELSLKNLRDGFSKLNARMRRKYGTRHYVKVWEMHKDKTLHLHLLVNGEVDARWLKDSAVACGLGYQVDSRPVDNAGQVAGYIAKYTLKNAAHLDDMPKNLRRIQTSLKFPKLPDRSRFSDDWQWSRHETTEGVFKSAQALLNRGYEIHDTTNFDMMDR